MGLPGNGTIPAVESRRRRLARTAGQRIIDLVAKNIRPRDIVTQDAVHNAFAVDMALGGSSNSVLHLTAIATEAGLRFPLSMINEVSRVTPQLCKLSPAGPQHIEDLDRAGGIQAVMKELGGRLKLNALTVTGSTVGENVAAARVKDAEVIRPTAKAYSPTGSLAILFRESGSGWGRGQERGSLS